MLHRFIGGRGGNIVSLGLGGVVRDKVFFKIGGSSGSGMIPYVICIGWTNIRILCLFC